MFFHMPDWLKLKRCQQIKEGGVSVDNLPCSCISHKTLKFREHHNGERDTPLLGLPPAKTDLFSQEGELGLMAGETEHYLHRVEEEEGGR